jgi:hypothetical protein
VLHLPGTSGATPTESKTTWVRIDESKAGAIYFLKKFLCTKRIDLCFCFGIAFRGPINRIN